MAKDSEKYLGFNNSHQNFSNFSLPMEKNFESFRGGATDQKFELGVPTSENRKGVRVPHGVIGGGCTTPLPPCTYVNNF